MPEMPKPKRSTSGNTKKGPGLVAGATDKNAAKPTAGAMKKKGGK